MIYYLDPSVLSGVSCFVMLLCLADYLVPALAPRIFGSSKWYVTSEPEDTLPLLFFVLCSPLIIITSTDVETAVWIAISTLCMQPEQNSCCPALFNKLKWTVQRQGFVYEGCNCFIMLGCLSVSFVVCAYLFLPLRLLPFLQLKSMLSLGWRPVSLPWLMCCFAYSVLRTRQSASRL